VIYRNSDLVRSINWAEETNPEAGELTRKFLIGERELMCIAHVRSSTIVSLTMFLENVAGWELVVERGGGGEMLVRMNSGSEKLLLMGQAAGSLRAYLDDEPTLITSRCA
jgi:hypothetical protein